jgi:hypothetical protein
MAWTITETIEFQKIKDQQGDEMITITLDCSSDGSGTDYDITAANMAHIKGSLFYALKIIPGTGEGEPSAAFDCDIEDGDDLHILDTDSNATAPAEGAIYHGGGDTMGVYPLVEDQISLVCGTLGDTNTAKFKLYFSKQ